MKSLKKALFFGFLVWVIPFVVAIFIFPLRISERPLFESIMPVALTITVVVFSNQYFRELDKEFLKEGILLGIIWLVVSVAIDLLMFMQGPMKMTFLDYMKDIGITYLIIPAITIGFGYLVKERL